MKDYRKLTVSEQQEINKAIIDEIEPKRHVNEHNGFEWNEPEYTLNMVQNGHYCADCWTIGYNCLCSHFD